MGVDKKMKLKLSIGLLFLSGAAFAQSKGYSGEPPVTAGENALNPAVSLILNGTYGNLSRDPARFRINGFAPTLGEVNPPNRGLSLGESELAFSANIDHHFRGTLIASIAPDDRIAIEEGYLQTIGLSNGFTVKSQAWAWISFW